MIVDGLGSYGYINRPRSCSAAGEITGARDALPQVYPYQGSRDPAGFRVLVLPSRPRATRSTLAGRSCA